MDHIIPTNGHSGAIEFLWIAIQSALEGGREGIRTLDLEPGDLQFSAAVTDYIGSHEWHRIPNSVTPPSSLTPSKMASSAGSRELNKKVLPEHLAAEQNALAAMHYS